MFAEYFQCLVHTYSILKVCGPNFTKIFAYLENFSEFREFIQGSVSGPNRFNNATKKSVSSAY